jgi:hypothetical protein
MQKGIQPPACSDHNLHIILSSYWMAHFYLIKKIRQSAALFWFGLRDVGILYSRAVIQRTNNVSPAFLEQGSAEKIGSGLCTKPNKQEFGFIEHEVAQNF